MRRALLILILGLAAACSSSSDDPSANAAADTQTSRQQPTTTVPPEQAFRDAIDARLDYTEPAFETEAVDLAQLTCDTLTAVVTGPAEDDAANDTPRTDAAISQQLIDMALASVIDADTLPDDVAAIILLEGSQAFCPSYLADVQSYIDRRGIELPPA